jgi:hypothetical protein
MPTEGAVHNGLTDYCGSSQNATTACCLQRRDAGLRFPAR